MIVIIYTIYKFDFLDKFFLGIFSKMFTKKYFFLSTEIIVDGKKHLLHTVLLILKKLHLIRKKLNSAQAEHSNLLYIFFVLLTESGFDVNL